MVYCPNCGERNKNSAKYCSNCGESLRFKSPSKSYSNKGSVSDKPLQSKFKSKESRRNGNLKRNKVPVEKPQSYSEVKEDSIEWNVVFVGALILLIIAGVLNTILPQISFWIAAIMAIVYALTATKRTSTLFFVIPLILAVALALWAFFNI